MSVENGTGYILLSNELSVEDGTGYILLSNELSVEDEPVTFYSLMS